MKKEEKYVIVGAGIAGVHAAETLRKEGFQGEIVLIDRDSELPYDRPPLSKQYLAGNLEKIDIMLRPKEFFDDYNINLKLGKNVIDLNIDKQYIETEDRDLIYWDKILITTGSKLNKLKIPGNELNHIYYLKRKEDAKQLRKRLKNIKDIVIVGAGFIGSEVAATCRELNINVTLIEATPIPLATILGDDMGSFISNLHRSNGVDLITNEFVSEFRGNNKDVEEVVTNTGRRIPCQVVLVGIGVSADFSWLKETKIKTGSGIEVDTYCETSVKGIFAAGDCVLWPYQGKKIRVEHWDHAIQQAKVAANNMIKSKSEAYNAVPYFWSDQYGMQFQYLGYTTKWENTILRGNLEDKEFTFFYIVDNKVVGALFVNNAKDVLTTRRFIKEGTEFKNLNDLADLDRSLKKI